MAGAASPGQFSARRIGNAIWDAKWALLVPIIVLGGIYGGLMTPTEAAAVAAMYGLLVGVFRLQGAEFFFPLPLLRGIGANFRNNHHADGHGHDIRQCHDAVNRCRSALRRQSLPSRPTRSPSC